MAKTKTKKQPELQNKGSLITYEDEGQTCCLGSLMDFKEHGVWDAELGKVDVTPEEATTHNKLLDEALVKGLDESCGIGQGGTFYLYTDPLCIKTFSGTVVSERVTRKGRRVTFLHGDKVFQGTSHTEDDLFNFERIA